MEGSNEMDEQESNVGHSGHGTIHEALPSAPSPGQPQAGSQEEYRKDEYIRAKLSLDKAMDLLKIYEEIGIAPCDIPRIHSAVRSAFGYGP